MPRYPHEIQERLDAISRTMRVKGTEKIARWMMGQISLQHFAFMDRIFKAIPQLPTWQSVLDNRKELSTDEITKILPHDEGCECCHTKAVSDYSPAQIRRIRNQFIERFGANTSDKLNASGDKFLVELFGPTNQATAIDISDSGMIYRRGMRATIIAAQRDAFNKALKVWERLPLRLRSTIDLLALKAYPFDPQQAFIKEIYKSGFELVSSKVTKNFLPDIKSIILRGLIDEISWQEIAVQLDSQIGVGGLWQWERLVRSEMAMAIDRAQVDRYRGLGVKYVKWSARPNRCRICNGFHGRIFRIDKAPLITQDTHPNCACQKNPLFNLPRDSRAWSGENFPQPVDVPSDA